MAGIGLQGAWGVAGAQDAVQQLLAQRMQQEAIRQQMEQQTAQGARADRGLDLESRGLDLEQERMNAPPPPDKPMSLNPGSSLVDPATGRIITQIPERPEKPQGPMNLSPGGRLIDPSTGRVIASAPFAPDRSSADSEWILRGGQPTQIQKGTAQPGDAPYTAPRSTSETAQDRQQKGRLEAAQGFLKRLEELRGKINSKIGPQAGISGLARQGVAAIGWDPDVAEYERIRAAGGRAVAVAIMGAQNLSDQDAAAWSNMLPGARIDAVTAKRLTDQISRMLEDTLGEAPATNETGETKDEAIEYDFIGGTLVPRGGGR